MPNHALLQARHLLLWLVFFQAVSATAADSAHQKTKSAGDDLFTNTVIRRLRIEIPASGMDILRRYEFHRNANENERIPVPAKVWEGTNLYTNVAIHLKGGFGSFRPVNDKPGLTLNFDKFAEGQRFHGLQKISLNNSVQDASFISDKLCLELFARAGIPAPRADYALVELNGRNLGLYVLTEGWNKQFLRRYFKDAGGNLYDGSYSADVNRTLRVGSGDKPEDESELKALAAAAAEKDLGKRFAEMERLLDMDRFITFLALGVLVWDWDGYAMNRNNFRLFHDLESHRLVFMPHGMDQMFWRPDGPIVTGTKGLVSRALLQTPEGRRRYLETFRALRTNVFDMAVITNRVLQIGLRIRSAAASGGLMSVFGFASAKASLLENIILRAASVDEQLAGVQGLLKLAPNEAVPLSGWKESAISGKPVFEKTDAPAALHISAQKTSAAAWRTTVWLEYGRYVIEGRIKTGQVEASRRDPRGGAGLRVISERKSSDGLTWDWFPYRESDEHETRGEIVASESENKRYTGTTDWTDARYEIDLREPIADLVILCELRGTGEVWFDPASLKIRRK